MSWIKRLLGLKATELTYDQVADLIDGVGGGKVAGQVVTDKTALQVSTVLACVRVIADGCATPRLRLYRETTDGKREHATNIPECRLLERRPNEWQTSFEWRRLMTIHAALAGTGLSVKVMGDSAVDAQQVETRRLQVEEVCRAYGVFPIMVGHSDKSSTFASSEAFFGAHVKHTLAPWHTAWTQRLDETLLDGSGPLYTEFDVRYLLAGSMRDRAVYARTMVEMGLLSPNEWRDEEGRDPRAGGDEYLKPMNMTGSKPGGANDGTTDPTAP